MVDSRLGRTERPEIGRPDAKLGRCSKARHGEVRQPVALLPLVHAGALEPLVQALCDPSGPLRLVIENDHADASRLAVAPRREGRKLEAGAGLLERLEDGWNVRDRPVSEEGERNVQLVAPDGTKPLALRECVSLPVDEPVDNVVGKSKRAEEPKPVTPLDASRQVHAEASPF